MKNSLAVQKNAVLLPPLLREVSDGMFLKGSRRKSPNGAVVQLVRIPACHAVGREFESRPHRKGENRRCFLLCRFQEINLLNGKFEEKPGV